MANGRDARGVAGKKERGRARGYERKRARRDGTPGLSGLGSDSGGNRVGLFRPLDEPIGPVCETWAGGATAILAELPVWTVPAALDPENIESGLAFVI